MEHYSSRTKTTSTKTTVTKDTKDTLSKYTDRSQPKDHYCQQKHIDGGIYPYGYEYSDDCKPPLPNNWKEINRKLVQPRPSLSPSRFPEKDYHDFIQADATAYNEKAVEDSVRPAMLTAMGASKGAQLSILFNNMVPITNYISQAKPDYYHGAQPEQIHQQVRTDLGPYIIPSNYTHRPAVPNFLWR